MSCDKSKAHGMVKITFPSPRSPDSAKACRALSTCGPHSPPTWPGVCPAFWMTDGHLPHSFPTGPLSSPGEVHLEGLRPSLRFILTPPFWKGLCWALHVPFPIKFQQTCYYPHFTQGETEAKMYKWLAEEHRASGTRLSFSQRPPHLISKISSTAPVDGAGIPKSPGICVRILSPVPFIKGSGGRDPNLGVGWWVKRWWEGRGGYVLEVFPRKDRKKNPVFGKTMSWVKEDPTGLATELTSVEFAAISWLSKIFIFYVFFFHMHTYKILRILNYSYSS